jgi:purine-nucleoside phosphorylase
MTSAAIAVVAGSGLDLTGALDSVDQELSFADVEIASGFARGASSAPMSLLLRDNPPSREANSCPERGHLSGTGVEGHAGRFVLGHCAGTRVIVQCGRLHLYEGLAYDSVVQTVDALHALGARTAIFTNAAGGLEPQMRPGDLMAANAVRLWRYRGWPDAPECLIPDFQLAGCDVRGAYHWVHGPCYETRAEISALRASRSSAVGMSTAPEMHRAQRLGMRSAAISCITNNCCTPQHLTHAHVLRTAAAASARLCTLLRRHIQGIADANHATSSRNVPRHRDV